MNMLYNSESFAVVQFDLPADTAGAGDLRRGGYEIVDKSAGKEIYLEGALAESFKLGVQALIDQKSTSIEEFDAYIGRYTPLMQQPLVLH